MTCSTCNIVPNFWQVLLKVVAAIDTDTHTHTQTFTVNPETHPGLESCTSSLYCAFALCLPHLGDMTPRRPERS